MMTAAFWLLVMCAAQSGQQPNPVDVLRRAIEEHARGDLAHAIEDYRQVLAARPDMVQARLNLGAALAQAEKLDEAIAVLKAAPEKDRANPEIRLNLSLAYYRKNDLAAAIVHLATLHADRPNDVQVSRLLTDCYLRSGAPEKALAVVRPAAEAHPANPDIAYQFGTALIRTGKRQDALEPLERAGAAGRSAEPYLLAGATAMDLGQFQRAHADIEKAIGIDPDIPGAWTWAGLARDRVSDEEGAKAAFRRALQANPRDFEANLHLGAILYRERDMQAAKPYLEKAVALDASSPLALYAIALVRSNTKELEQAVKDLQQVVRMAPNWIEPHVKLASLYYRLKRDADGQRERDIIDRLKREHREQPVAFPTLENQ